MTNVLVTGGPVPVNGSGGWITLKHVEGDTVYVGNSEQVSPAAHESQLTAGQTLTVGGGVKYLVTSKTGRAKLYATNEARARSALMVVGEPVGGESPTFDLAKQVFVPGNAGALAALLGLAVAKAQAPFVTLDRDLFVGANIDAALTAAKTALGAKGGRIVVPPHTAGAPWEVANPPSFADTNNVVLEGSAGANGGSEASSWIIYTGSGARCWDFRSARGGGLVNLQLTYSNAAFTGRLIDLDMQAGSNATTSMLIDRCYIGGSGVGNAAALISLNNAISSRISNNVFGFGQIQIRGKVTSNDFCNAMLVDGNTFLNYTLSAIRDLGEGCAIVGNTFEPGVNDTRVAGYEDWVHGCNGLHIAGNWFGDGGIAATGVAATDIVTTSVAHNYVANDIVRFSALTGGAGLSVNTPYYVRDVTATTFKLAATSGGAAINFTTDITASLIVGGQWVFIAGNAASITGNYLATAARGIWVGNSCSAVHVTGNRMLNMAVGVTFGANMSAAHVAGNAFETITDAVTFAAGAKACTVASNKFGSVSAIVVTPVKIDGTGGTKHMVVYPCEWDNATNGIVYTAGTAPPGSVLQQDDDSVLRTA